MTDLINFLIRRFFHYFACPLIGHSSQQQLVPLFRPWYGGMERGTVHCKRCGRMVGEYGIDVVESVHYDFTRQEKETK